MSVRTRFAPSPTGELHLGNARTAILNWLVARHENGAFVLRFEDTDVERNVAASESDIMESLDWLGLDRDEDPIRGGPYGPYRQSERDVVYRTHAERLLGEGLAYRCYCRPEELESRRAAALTAGVQPRYDGRCRELSAEERERLEAGGRVPSIRFRVQPGPVRFEDRVRGAVTIDGSEFGDMVILRSDGRPTYNFAVVVDDMLMEITQVIRGVGHLPNTPKQVLLYQAFGAPVPEFIHIPTVLAPGGGKLSKREGSPGLSSYQARGYHPFAVVNYLSLLSWSAPGGEEVMTPAQLVEWMDLDRIGASNAILDLDKMYWLSGQHIRLEPIAELVDRVRPFLGPVTGALDDAELEVALSVIRERVFLFSEAAVELDALFAHPSPDPDAEAALRAPDASAVLGAVGRRWDALNEWSPAAIKKAMIAAGKEANVKGKGLFQPVRAALTGRLQGPELAEVAFILGPERSADRLDTAVRDGSETD
jgi:nondiscriminating glutamyl-tRNA synthetase